MYLGIDLGTSSVKTILMDADQRVLASASAALTVQRPQDGWSEQDPESWWLATCQTMDQLAAENGLAMSQVKGIGLSGQMHGATLLDKDDNVLYPAILWNDSRSEAQCKTLEANCMNSRELSGNIAMPGFTAPKILWIAATGLDQSHMPRLVEGSQSSARLLSELQQKWGIIQPVEVAGGAGDNAAAACGNRQLAMAFRNNGKDSC